MEICPRCGVQVEWQGENQLKRQVGLCGFFCRAVHSRPVGTDCRTWRITAYGKGSVHYWWTP